FIQIPVQNPKVLFLVFLNESLGKKKNKPSSMSVIVAFTIAEASINITPSP
ncbi:hypothetical protein ATANTOWER_026473, partial [Ataeniobius toweri]|nr:hypothetical protein [Ataeniobius toweri]